MQIRPVIDKAYRETQIHVCKDTLDEEVKNILSELHTLFDETLSGTDEKGNRCLIKPAEVFSFYAEGQRVFAMDHTHRYSLSKKLYELEESLGSHGFVRISKSEIVNVKRIRSLDMSISGTIRVIMKNGYETFASRRNVAKLKELLVSH